MPIRIDKDVPPPEDGQRGEKSKIIQQMEYGDSIFVTSRQDFNAFRASIQYHGNKVMSRKEGKGWRIWKLKREN